MSCNIKCVLWLLPINELALIQPTLQINRAIIAYLHLHFRQALPPNPRVCLCLCVHLSLSLLGLYGELVWLFSPSCPKSSVYLMLWPVDEGEEVPVGWSFWCFLQDRGGIFFRGREDFCSGLFFFSVKGGECSDVVSSALAPCPCVWVLFFLFFSHSALKSRQICSPCMRAAPAAAWTDSERGGY